MNVYKNQASGLVVATGKIKSVSEDRMVMTVTSEQYDRTAKKNEEVELNVSSGTPFEDSFKNGYGVTVAGYQRGKGAIVADAAFIGNDYFETQDLAVVTGLVKYARLNEEKDENGAPKMKQDGKTPKKPHYDVTISVNEGDKWVDHVIRIYEGIHEEGKKSQMDRAAALFSKFDKESNRIRATFVTSPGQSYSRTVTKNGKEYVNYGCSHIGFKFMDVEFVDQKEKAKNTPAAEKPESAPVQQTPAPTPAPQPQAPVQSGNGFEQNLALDEDELFK